MIHHLAINVNDLYNVILTKFPQEIFVIVHKCHRLQIKKYVLF